MKAIPLFLFTAALVVFRLLPHPENFAPFGAFALVAGMIIGFRPAALLPLVALFLSDIALNLAAGYPPVYLPRLIDYSAFVLIAGLGVIVRERGFVEKVVSGISTPFVFFLLSNFGVWLFGRGITGLPYSKSLAGLIECYVAGLPFLRGTIAGDWFFLAAFALFVALVRLSRSEFSKLHPIP